MGQVVPRADIYFKTELPDYGMNFAKGLAIGELIKQRRLKSDLQAKNLQDMRDVEEAFKSGVRTDPFGGFQTLDKTQVINNLMQRNPKLAAELKQKFDLDEADRQIKKYKQEISNYDLMARNYGNVKSQEDLDFINQVMEQKGFNIPSYLRVYSPKTIKDIVYKSTSTKDKISNAMRELMAGLKSQAIKQTIDFNKFKIAQNLRKEYLSLPQTKGVGQYVKNFSRLRRSLKSKNASGDYSAIFNFNKMLDENSVVRESEFKNSANMTSLKGKIQNALKKLETGEFLTQQQRDEILTLAEGFMDDLVSIQKPIIEKYTYLATKNKIDPADIIVPIGYESLYNIGRKGKKLKKGGPAKEVDVTDEELEELTKPIKKTKKTEQKETRMAAPKEGEIIDGYMFKGGDPSKRENWLKIIQKGE